MEKFFSATKCLGQEDVQKYLKAQLNEQERFTVENHLLECPLCSDAVEGFANHYNFDENVELEQIQELINNTAAPASTTPVRTLPKRFSFNRIAAAALILLLPLAGLMYWQSGHAPQLAKAFSPIQDNSVLADLRASEENNFQNPYLQKGMAAYDLKQYQQSLEYYQSALAEEPENTLAIFFSGVVCLELGKTKEAIPLLTSSRLNDERLYEQSTWYLVMAHLALNEKEEAQLLLNDLLKNKNGIYYLKAVEKKKEMNGE